MAAPPPLWLAVAELAGTGAVEGEEGVFVTERERGTGGQMEWEGPQPALWEKVMHLMYSNGTPDWGVLWCGQLHFQHLIRQWTRKVFCLPKQHSWGRPTCCVLVLASPAVIRKELNLLLILKAILTSSQGLKYSLSYLLITLTPNNSPLVFSIPWHYRKLCCSTNLISLFFISLLTQKKEGKFNMRAKSCFLK